MTEIEQFLTMINNAHISFTELQDEFTHDVQIYRDGMVIMFLFSSTSGSLLGIENTTNSFGI